MIDYQDDEEQADSPASGTMSIGQVATVLIVGGLAFWLGRNLPAEPITVRSTSTVLTGRPFAWQPDPPDGDFSIEATLPEGMHWDAERKLLHWLPATEQAGDHSVAVLQSGPVNIRYEMKLAVISANRPPRFISYPSGRIGTSRKYLSPFTGHDPEGDPLTYRLTEKPAGMMLLRRKGEPVLRWNPESLEGGPWPVTVELDDGSTTVSHQFEISQPQVILQGELAEDMLLHYTFSGELVDLTGNTHTARNEGAGIDSGALILDGQSSFVEIPYNNNNGLHPNSAPFTVSAWFMTDAKTPRDQVVLGTHYSGPGADGYYISVRPDGRIYWFLFANNRNYIFLVAEGEYNDGGWHHVAGVWEGEEIRLYVDGMFHSKRPADGDLVYEQKAPFRIGHLGGPDPAQYHFNGAIDDVLIHGRALTAESIATLYKLGRSEGE
jgi:hypothetical protein